jgi:hypothetical protein
MLFSQIAASAALLLGLYLYDRKRDDMGPILSMWACVLWAFICLALEQPAMVVLNLILATLHFRNFYKRCPYL